jgi:hypothetical protein
VPASPRVGQVDVDARGEVVRGAGERVLRTPIRAPSVNALCERFLGGVQLECLPSTRRISDSIATIWIRGIMPDRRYSAARASSRSRSGATFSGAAAARQIIFRCAPDRGGLGTRTPCSGLPSLDRASSVRRCRAGRPSHVVDVPHARNAHAFGKRSRCHAAHRRGKQPPGSSGTVTRRSTSFSRTSSRPAGQGGRGHLPEL